MVLSSFPKQLRCQTPGEPPILVVDDEKEVRKAINNTLKAAGYQTIEANDGLAALAILKKTECSLVLTDLKMPKCNGLEFIKSTQKEHEDLPVILMSAYATIDIAFKAISEGAQDYLSKPFMPEDLLWSVAKTRERLNLKKENDRLNAELISRSASAEILGTNQEIIRILEKVKKISDFSTTVLIEGESGTGKELIARAIHKHSARREKPFIAVNCGAIPETLLESELFGHKKGAFTDASADKSGLFKAADGGTILLDEIGELPLKLQVKLLRVLQEREVRPVGAIKNEPVDIRIVAATLRDLEQDIEDGLFRQDLYFRLNVLRLKLPPLRERKEDIPLLVTSFLERYSEQMAIEPPSIENQAMEALLNYSWPGNIRELENSLERAIIMSDRSIVRVKNLPADILEHEVSFIPNFQNPDSLSLKKNCGDLEKLLIDSALKKTGGNRTYAAKLLEVSHRTLLYKLKKYEIS